MLNSFKNLLGTLFIIGLPAHFCKAESGYVKTEVLAINEGLELSLGKVKSQDAIQYLFQAGPVVVVKSSERYKDSMSAKSFCDSLGNGFDLLDMNSASQLVYFANGVNGPFRNDKNLEFINGLVSSVEEIFPTIYTWQDKSLEVLFTVSEKRREVSPSDFTLAQIDQHIAKLENPVGNNSVQSPKNLCIDEIDQYYLSSQECDAPVKACSYGSPYSPGAGGFLYLPSNGGTCPHTISLEDEIKLKKELLERYLSALASQENQKNEEELALFKILRNVVVKGQQSYCLKVDQ